MTLAGAGLAPCRRLRFGSFRAKGTSATVLHEGDRRMNRPPLPGNLARCSASRKNPMKSVSGTGVPSQCQPVSPRRSCPDARIPCFAGLGAVATSLSTGCQVKTTTSRARCIAARFTQKSQKPNKTTTGAGVQSQCQPVSLSAFPPLLLICVFSNRQMPSSGSNRERTHDTGTSTPRSTTRALDGGMDQPT